MKPYRVVQKALIYAAASPWAEAERAACAQKVCILELRAGVRTHFIPVFRIVKSSINLFTCHYHFFGDEILPKTTQRVSKILFADSHTVKWSAHTKFTCCAGQLGLLLYIFPMGPHRGVQPHQGMHSLSNFDACFHSSIINILPGIRNRVKLERFHRRWCWFHWYSPSVLSRCGQCSPPVRRLRRSYGAPSITRCFGPKIIHSRLRHGHSSRADNRHAQERSVLLSHGGMYQKLSQVGARSALVFWGWRGCGAKLVDARPIL